MTKILTCFPSRTMIVWSSCHTTLMYVVTAHVPAAAVVVARMNECRRGAARSRPPPFPLTDLVRPVSGVQVFFSVFYSCLQRLSSGLR